jgi:hypothetical protein
MADWTPRKQWAASRKPYATIHDLMSLLKPFHQWVSSDQQ